jgi:hypothetical protein
MTKHKVPTRYLREKKLLTKALRKWTYRLGLRWWTVTAVWFTDPKEIKKEFKTDNGWRVQCRAYVKWMYSEASLHVNLPSFKGFSKRYIERVIVHELMHVLVNEMREGELHHEERVVTQLTKAIFWTVFDVADKSG